MPGVHPLWEENIIESSMCTSFAVALFFSVPVAWTFTQFHEMDLKSALDTKTLRPRPNHDAPAGCHEAGARGDAHESGHRADGGAHTAGFASTNAGKPPGGRAGWRMLHRAVGLVLKNLWKVCTTWHDPFLLRIRTSIPKKLE